MKNTALLAVALATLAIATGCGKSEKDFVGKWTGKATVSDAAKKDDPTGMGASMLSSMKFELDLKADKTYTMSMIFPIEGKWAYENNQVTLTPTKMMGQDVANMGGDAGKDVVMTVKDDKTLSMKLAEGDENSPIIVYTKS